MTQFIRSIPQNMADVAQICYVVVENENVYGLRSSATCFSKLPYTHFGRCLPAGWDHELTVVDKFNYKL